MDSTILLQDISNKDRRFQTFVANCMAKIQERSEPTQWNHVDSASNPADDVSSGMTAQEIVNSKRWVSGSAFLGLGRESWPVQLNLEDLPEDAEVKHSKDIYTTGTLTKQGPPVEAADRLLQRYSC